MPGSQGACRGSLSPLCHHVGPVLCWALEGYSQGGGPVLSSVLLVLNGAKLKMLSDQGGTEEEGLEGSLEGKAGFD